MTSDATSPPRPPDLDAEIARVVAMTRAAVTTPEIDGLVADMVVDAIGRVALEILGSARPPIERYLSSFRRSLPVVVEQLRNLDQVRAAQPARWQDAWWERERHRLAGLLADDPPTGIDAYLRVFTDALLAGRLSGCERLLADPSLILPGDAAAVRALMREGLEALRAGRYLDALPLLAHLGVERSATGPLLDNAGHALQQIFIGHILLYDAEDHRAAQAHFERARELAHRDGRPLAAMGDCLRWRSLREHDSAKRSRLRDRAHKRYQEACTQSPGDAAGFIGLGLLADDGGKDWSEADDMYEKAAARLGDDLAAPDVATVVGRRRGPVSGSLCLKVARFLAAADPAAALEAVDRALEEGIAGPGSYPERLAYRLKGELLQKAGRDAESATAYFDAGCRFSWAGEQELAIEALTKAAALAPEHAPTRWYLADNLNARASLPDPPFVDGKKVAEALKAWQGAKQRPDRESCWAYLTRAYISERQAQLPGANLPDLYWQAVLYTERAIALAPDDEQNWRFLSDYYGRLGLQANAQYAAQQAIRLRPDSREALRAMIVASANAGAFARSLKLLRKFRDQTPDSSPAAVTAIPESAWIDSVEAFIRCREGNYEEARDQFDRALKAIAAAPVPGNVPMIWILRERAACLRLLDEWVPAEQAIKTIWARYSPDDMENQHAYAWAAYHLGKADEGIRILNRIPRAFPDFGDTDRLLGLCMLAKRDFARGAELLTRGIAAAGVAMDLRQLTELEFRELRGTTPTRTDGAELNRVLDELTARAAERRAQLSRPRSAIQEVVAVTTALDAAGGRRQTAWTAAHATIARLRVDRDQWPSAGRALRELRYRKALFPEVNTLITQSVDALTSRAEQQLAKGDTAEAVQTWTQGLALVGKLRPGAAAALHSRLAAAKAGDDPAAAARHLTRALHLFGEDGRDRPADAVADECRPLLRDIGQYWQADDAWERLARQHPAHAATVAAIRQRLSGFVDESLDLTDPVPVTYDERPVVELPWAVIPADTGPQWALFQTYVPEMRARVAADLGVLPPHISFRGNAERDDNGYRILLTGYPVVDRRELPVDRRFSPRPPEEFEQDGIDAEATIDPVTGERASWATAPDAAEPLYYIVRHLEAVLRAHLYEYVGLDTVAELIDPLRTDESGAALIGAAVPDAAARLRFSRVIRALLREGVPVTPIREVLGAVGDGCHADDRLEAALRAVRLRLHHRLPGNAPDAVRVRLTPELAAVADRLTREPPATTVDHEELHGFLQSVGALTAGAAGLVVDDASLRLRLRRLLAAEHPDLAVLTVAEALPPAAQIEPLSLPRARATESAP